MTDWSKKSHGFWTYIKTKGRIWVLLCGALLGVALLLFGGRAPEGEVSEESDALSGREVELEEYGQRLEGELEALIESVSGVGDAHVMVTFESGYTVRYVKDAEGATATVGSGSSEQALFSCVVPPTVSGVGVVCRGGNNPQVREVLTDLVCASLGISSNRVYITGK